MDYGRKPLSIFISYMARHRKLFIIDMVCSVMVAIVDLVFPYVSRTAMNTYLPNNMFRTFYVVMIIMLLAYGLKAVLYYIITYIGHKMGVLTESDMRRDLFCHIQELSCTYFDNNRTGVLLSRITSDLFDITELAHHGPENLIICAMTIIGSLALMFTLNWRLALILAIVLPVCMWLTLSQRFRMRNANLEVKRKTGTISASIENSISGIRTAKAFANEEMEIEKFDISNDMFKGSKEEYYKSMGLYMSGMEFTTGIMPVVVILAGGIMIMKGTLDYVDLITFTLYVSTYISPLRKLVQTTEYFMAGSAGFSRFLEIMRTEPDIKDAEDAAEMKNVEGRIEYKNVSFTYANGTEVLKNINLTIEKGKCVAIVGPSGGGKTTLCQILPRFYEVSDGQVLIDGTDITTVKQNSLRKNIGLLQQDVFIFAGTIEENIAYGNPGASHEEIVKAAMKAEIHDEILEMPNGYDTNVGERGVRLSGGQKQRISIARVFLKNPKILILDEATSALDTITEMKIQAAFDKLAKGRTTLIVAHRLSTVRNADEIVVIDDAGIAETGTHEDLIRKGGKYAQLCSSQGVI